MARRAVTAASVIGLLLVTSGCAAMGPQPEPTPTELSTDERRDAELTTQVTPEWTAEMKQPIGSEVVLAADTLLAFERRVSGPNLVGFDAATGERKWRVEAGPGSKRGEDLTWWAPAVTRTENGRAVTLVSGAPTYQPNGDWAHTLTMVDIASGESTELETPTWVSTIEQCGEEICVEAWKADDGGTWYDTTFDPDAVALVPDEEDDGSTDSWEMTPDVTMGVADDTFTLYDANHDEVWTDTLSELLPEGLTTEAFGDGFGFSMATDDKYDPSVLIVSFTDVGKRSDSGMFAVDVTSGELLWNRAGTKLCQFNAPALCPPAADSDAGSVTGVDPATGEQSWSFALEPGENTTTVGDAPNPAGADLIYAMAGGEVEYHDTRTGEVVSLPEGARFVCVSEPAQSEWTWYANQRTSDEMTTYHSASMSASCDPSGAEANDWTIRAVADAAGSAWKDGEEHSSEWMRGTPVEDPLDEEKAWYYVQTESGIAAFRF